jgi:hypothetical protein
MTVDIGFWIGLLMMIEQRTYRMKPSEWQKPKNPDGWRKKRSQKYASIGWVKDSRKY